MIFGELDLCVVPQQWAGVVKDVRSNTEYGMNSDHFPLEVTLQVRLSARRPDKAGPPQARYDFRGLDEEAKAGLDARVIQAAPAMEVADSVDTAWGLFAEAAMAAMKECVPEKVRKPRRPWITPETMELVEHRKALAAAGFLLEARELDKAVKACAREDKRHWIERGLEESFWDPIREMSRKRPPQVVSLRPPGGNSASRLPVNRVQPAEVYAEHLEKSQWGKETEVEGQGEEGEQAPPGETLVERAPLRWMKASSVWRS